MHIATISSKRQITIPKVLLDYLSLDLYDKTLITKGDNMLLLRPISDSVVEELSGSLKKYISKDKFGIPFRKVRSETQKIIAKHLASKNG